MNLNLLPFLCRKETNQTSLGESLETLLAHKCNFHILSSTTKVKLWLTAVSLRTKHCPFVWKVDKQCFGTSWNQSSARKIWTSGSPVKNWKPTTIQRRWDREQDVYMRITSELMLPNRLKRNLLFYLIITLVNYVSTWILNVVYLKKAKRNDLWNKREC